MHFSTKPKIFMKLACRSGNLKINSLDKHDEVEPESKSAQDSFSQSPSSELLKKPSINNEAEVFTIWSNTSNKTIQDSSNLSVGGYLSKYLHQNLNDDETRYVPFQDLRSLHSKIAQNRR